MNCPNCGLANPDNAKFCSNCGTSFAGAPPQQPNYSQGQYAQNQAQYQAPPYQAPGAYSAPGPASSSNPIAKNIGIGCLIAIAIVLLFGLSCTRACFGLRHRSYIVRHR